MNLNQPSRLATSTRTALLTAVLMMTVGATHTIASTDSGVGNSYASSPAVTLGLEVSGIDKTDIATYSEFAESLLADATARVTAYGKGNVPAYAEHLKDVFIDGGFDPRDIHILPLDETVSLVVRY